MNASGLPKNKHMEQSPALASETTTSLGMIKIRLNEYLEQSSSAEKTGSPSEQTAAGILRKLIIDLCVLISDEKTSVNKKIHEALEIPKWFADVETFLREHNPHLSEQLKALDIESLSLSEYQKTEGHKPQSHTIKDILVMFKDDKPFFDAYLSQLIPSKEIKHEDQQHLSKLTKSNQEKHAMSQSHPVPKSLLERINELERSYPDLDKIQNVTGPLTTQVKAINESSAAVFDRFKIEAALKGIRIQAKHEFGKYDPDAQVKLNALLTEAEALFNKKAALIADEKAPAAASHQPIAATAITPPPPAADKKDSKTSPPVNDTAAGVVAKNSVADAKHKPIRDPQIEESLGEIVNIVKKYIDKAKKATKDDKENAVLAKSLDDKLTKISAKISDKKSTAETRFDAVREIDIVFENIRTQLADSKNKTAADVSKRKSGFVTLFKGYNLQNALANYDSKGKKEISEKFSVTENLAMKLG